MLTAEEIARISDHSARAIKRGDFYVTANPAMVVELCRLALDGRRLKSATVVWGSRNECGQRVYLAPVVKDEGNGNG